MKMKTTLLCLSVLLAAASGYARPGREAGRDTLTVISLPERPAREAAPAPGADEKSPTAKSEWLPAFDAVEVSAPIDIYLVCVPASEAPRIVFDTKGNSAVKFRAEVRDRVLRITERESVIPSARTQTTRTAATLYYNELTAFSVTDAEALFAETVSGQLFNLTVGGKAAVTLTFDVQDLQLDLSGHSRAVIDGAATYLTVELSTGSLDAKALNVFAARVRASNSGIAQVQANDRLEASTATGGRIYYLPTPRIIRSNTKFLGNDIQVLTE